MYGVGPGRGGRRHRGRRPGATPRWPSATSSASTCAGTTVGGCGAGSPDGGARHLAYAADYAWLVDCFTRLGELTGRARWTERAVETADALLDLFHDDEGGGFFTTGHDAEALIVRTKDVFDGATPSANAVAALSLARLGALTGDDRYTAGRPRGGGPARRPPGPAPDRLRPHVLTATQSLGRLDRGGDHRRPPRPGRRGPEAVAARVSAGLG